MEGNPGQCPKLAGQCDRWQMSGLTMALNGANGNQDLWESCPRYFPAQYPFFPQPLVSHFLGKVSYCFGMEGVDFSTHGQHKPTSPTAQAAPGPVQPLRAGNYSPSLCINGRQGLRTWSQGIAACYLPRLPNNPLPPTQHPKELPEHPNSLFSTLSESA